MKLFHGLILASSTVSALEFLSSWNDQPDEDAFSWIEPKSRLRREGDADDEKVLQFVSEREQRSKKSPPQKKQGSKKQRWQMQNGKIQNKKGKWVTPSKRPDDDTADGDYDDYDAYDILVGTDVPEEELDELVNEIIALRSIDKKEFYDLAQSEGTQIALEKFALREYSRKKLGRKLTSEEKEQRQKIRAARRKRKQNRRLEQERRREWRKLHRNKETGDYDEYGPYQPQYEKGHHKKKSKKQNRREKRQKRKENKGKKKGKGNTTKKPVQVQTTEETRSPDFEDYAYEAEPTTSSTSSTSTSTTTTTTTTMTTSTVITTVPTEPPKKFGRERTEDLFTMFEGETFANATIDDIEYENFLEAKNEAIEWNDTTGQETLRKYELLKLMTIYLQPDEETKWSKFSGYGCYCFQSYDNEFWKGQGLPKDDIDKSCRSLSMCYHCIQSEETCSPDVKYEFIGLEDSATGDRAIMCLNPTGSCERNVCECDKRMAEELRRESETFNVIYDSQFALFDAATQCEKQVGTPAWDACCGTYPTRFPYSTEGSRACCGQSTYDTNFHDCCNEKIIARGMTCTASQE